MFFISAHVSGNDRLHPCLIFNDIDEIPGYQFRDLEPWSAWEDSILRNADYYTTFDFSDSKWLSYDKIIYRARFTRDLGLAYHISKDKKYLDKACEGLLNIGLGKQAAWSRANSLIDYGLAYDWVQPYLSKTDDRIIRNKYAAFADAAYLELNKNGYDRDYITFADYHGKVYPCFGVAGLVLSDFTNPDNIPLKSGPNDWIKVGTDYLFINDRLHSYNQPLITFGFDDESGKSYSGAYKGYVITNLLWWFQIYSYYYDRNIFDDYPISKKIVTSEIWETLPNGYMNNYCTSGNTLETYHRGILNLFCDKEKGIVKGYLEKTERNNILQYSSNYDHIPDTLLYLVYYDYDNIISDSPSSRNYLNPGAVYQVFRENWEEDSDWLSLVTFNEKTNSNRDSAHHDQLSIEYYSNGDLLLADAGENKKVIDKNYGKTEVHHNTIAVEDPRVPFPVSFYGNSQARGAFKGNSGGIVTPVEIVSIIQNSWIVLMQTKERITDVIGNDWRYRNKLSSPIVHSRTIIRPFNEYFIIVDNFDGKEEWIYRNVFRPTSLMIVPTQDLNGDKKYDESETGHVIGDLNIGGVSYDWLGLPYKKETVTGITTDCILWSVTSPYGDDIALNIFSVPASEILITKHVGRIAGYGHKSEVFSPVVYFRNEPAEELSRITLLLTGNDADYKRSAEEIAVRGNGNAVRAYTPIGIDYIYSGRGNSEFDRFSTDADIVLTRDFADNKDEYYLIIGGTYLTKDGLDFVTVDKENSKKIRISGLKPGNKSVILDGLETFNGELNADGNNISLSYSSGDHTIEIISESNMISIVIVDQDKPINNENYLINNYELPITKFSFGIPMLLT